ncbi:MAG: serine hydrolase domain-containing protein [Bacteroidota bacterium]
MYVFRFSFRLLRWVLVVLSSGILPYCAYAPASEPYFLSLPIQAPPLSAAEQALIGDYDQFFSSSMQSSKTPGAAVVIVKDGKIIFSKGYGVKTAASGDSVDVNTVFRIGSLSKGFAGVLTGMLVEQGKLTWDESVQKHYPAFTLKDPAQAKRMQIRHLLSQTTGLPYHAFTNLVEDGYSLQTIVNQYFPKAPISAPEGTFYSYQNAAFCVTEEVLRDITGKSYPELLSEMIFAPAGMRNASCTYAGMRDCPDKALPMAYTGNGWAALPLLPMYYNFAAAGGVNAGISDMGEWLKLLLGYKPELVSNATLDQVFAPVIKTSRERRIFPRWIGRDEASYAMGWRVLEHGGETIMYHGGYVNGYRGEIAFNRRDGIGICVLFNAHTSLCSEVVPAFFERWGKCKGGDNQSVNVGN